MICAALFVGNACIHASPVASQDGILSKKNNLELHIDSIKTTHGGSITPIIDDISYTRSMDDKHSFEVRRHVFEVEKLHLGSVNYESNIGTHFLIYRYTVWQNKNNRVGVGPALLTRRVNMKAADLDKTYHDNQAALNVSWYSDLSNDFFITLDTSLNYFGNNRNFFDSEITCSRLISNSLLYVGMGFHFQIHRRNVMSEVATFKSGALNLVIGLIF